ncbi:hypothetical protein F5884DRAFT_753594 [Xylogone sp. PMI_703]|nr:hypothetical protein F5884DRAFT_753594 [Xylogone sp. PMI_703]
MPADTIPIRTGPGTAGQGRGTRLPKDTLDALNALDLSGKTVLVTGTTNGLGTAVSKELLSRKVNRLIMGVRSLSRGEELKTRLLGDAQIKAANPHASIDVLHLEMEDYKSVVVFANKVKESTPTLDIAIMNAGVGGVDWSVSVTGHEKMLQVNLLSPFLLAIELIPLLEGTAKAKGIPSRLIIVGSWTQFTNSLSNVPMPLERGVIKHFDDKSKFDGALRYPDTQLLTTMLVKELGTRVERELVVIVEPTPPWTPTNWGSNYPEGDGRDFAMKMMQEIGLPLEEAVMTYIYAIFAEDEAHGQFLDDNMIAPRAPFVESLEGQSLQKTLWQELVEEYKRVDPKLVSLPLLQ